MGLSCALKVRFSVAQSQARWQTRVVSYSRTVTGVVLLVDGVISAALV